MLGSNKKIGGLLLGAGLLLAGGTAQADNYPSKPVHILVPYAAGGAVDVLARTLGQALAKSWGQQPVIDNRPSAGGIVASQALTQAAPDGDTLILVASGHPLNQFIYPSVHYDTFKDFTAITEVASSPLQNHPARPRAIGYQCTSTGWPCTHHHWSERCRQIYFFKDIVR